MPQFPLKILCNFFCQLSIFFPKVILGIILYHSNRKADKYTNCKRGCTYFCYSGQCFGLSFKSYQYQFVVAYILDIWGKIES